MEHVPEDLAVDLAVRIANCRTVWLCTIMKMIELGLLTEEDVIGMREQCLGAIRRHIDASSGFRRSFATKGAADLIDPFRKAVS